MTPAPDRHIMRLQRQYEIAQAYFMRNAWSPRLEGVAIARYAEWVDALEIDPHAKRAMVSMQIRFVAHQATIAAAERVMREGRA